MARSTDALACLQVAWGETRAETARAALVRLSGSGEIKPFEGGSAAVQLPASSRSARTNYRVRLFVFPASSTDADTMRGFCTQNMADANYDCPGDRQNCAFYFEFRPKTPAQVNDTFVIGQTPDSVCQVHFRQASEVPGSELPRERPKSELPQERPKSEPPQERPKSDAPVPDANPGCSGAVCSWFASAGSNDPDLISALAVHSKTGWSYVTGKLSDARPTFSSASGKTQQVSDASKDGELLLAILDHKGEWVSIFPQQDVQSPDHSVGLDIQLNDSQENVFVVGAFSGSLTLGGTTLKADATAGAGFTDGFVAKFKISGGSFQLDWARRIGGPGHDVATGVAVDSKSNIVVVGRSLRDPDDTRAQQDPKAAHTLAVFDGQSQLTPRSASDCCSYETQGDTVQFAIKLKNGGELDWLRTFAGRKATPTELKESPTNQEPPMGRLAPKVAIHAEERKDIAYIAGHFQGQAASFGSLQANSQGLSDMYVLKLSPQDGKLSWIFTAGSPGNDGLRDIAYQSGMLYVVGHCGGSSLITNKSSNHKCGDVKRDSVAFVARLKIIENNGKDVGVSVDKTTTADGKEFSIAYGVAINPAGEIFISGSFEKQITVGSTTQPSTPFKSNSAFVAGLNADLQWQWAFVGGDDKDDSQKNTVLDVEIAPSNTLIFGGAWNQGSPWGSLKTGPGQGKHDAFVARIPTSGAP